MMDLPTAFFTLDQLQTLMGQVTVVILMTQLVKSAVPRLPTYYLRLVAVISAIAIQVGLVAVGGGPLSAYALAPINGAMVALSAMKAAELIKGDTEAPK